MREPPRLAERSGYAKPRFRVGGGEPRVLQSKRRRDVDVVGGERLCLLPRWRQALDRVSLRLRSGFFSAVGVVVVRVRQIWAAVHRGWKPRPPGATPATRGNSVSFVLAMQGRAPWRRCHCVVSLDSGQGGPVGERSCWKRRPPELAVAAVDVSLRKGVPFADGLGPLLGLLCWASFCFFSSRCKKKEEVAGTVSMAPARVLEVAVLMAPARALVVAAGEFNLGSERAGE